MRCWQSSPNSRRPSDFPSAACIVVLQSALRLIPRRPCLPQHDDASWQALAALKPGDKITVTMATTIVPVTVHSVHAGGPDPGSASVICRFPTGVRIEVTHSDLVTGQRTFRRGWDRRQVARIRASAFAP